MKKLIALILALVMVFALAACGGTAKPRTDEDVQTGADTDQSGQDQENVTDDVGDALINELKGELIVFAAASMTETLTEIAEQLKEVAPELTIIYNFDSSGTLLTQVEEGADCDVFISAAPKQMDTLEADGYLMEGTRFDLLENKVALAVPEGNPANINSYDDLAAGLTGGGIVLAMGNSDVPVGQYTQKIFEYYGLNEAELVSRGVITYGSNVKEVTSQVSETAVDCGVIYCTDAYSAGLTVVDTATAGMCGQVIYPAAVLEAAPNAGAAQAYLLYLLTGEAASVFENVGFTALAAD